MLFFKKKMGPVEEMLSVFVNKVVEKIYFLLTNLAYSQ